MKNIKKLFGCFLCMLLVLASLSSCSIKLDLEPQHDIELYNVVDVFYEDHQPSYLYYKDERYICDRNGFFQSYQFIINQPQESDILLSWNGNIFFDIYTDMYYADTTDSPLFIYESRCDDVFFREDYNFLSDTFVIEGTTAEFLFSDMFKDFSKPINSSDYFKGRKYPDYEIYSKENPRLRTTFRVDCSQETCYLNIYSSYIDSMWECSDSFLKLLKNNGIV